MLGLAYLKGDKLAVKLQVVGVQSGADTDTDCRHLVSTVWAGQAAAAGPGAPPQPARQQIPGCQRAAAAPGLLLLRVPRHRPLCRGALSCTPIRQSFY